MLDGLAKMFSGMGNSLGDLFGGNNSLMASYNPAMESMGVTSDIWGGASPIEQAGILDSMKGLGLDKQGGLAGVLGNFDIMDAAKLGFGYSGMQEQKKNNKLNRKLTQQNIDENNRITGGREKAADIFNNTTSLAGSTYTA